MNQRSRPSSRHPILWIATPLLAVLAWVLIVAMAPAEPATQRPPRAAASPAPYVSSDPSLPASGSASITAEPQPHVQAF
jgi:cytoskeletal protein RodZ